MNTNYHHGDLKQALLTHAQALMEQGQINKLSMREMAKSVGVSHTAAYRHFTNKRELLDAVAVQGFNDMLDECESAVRKAGNNPKSRLKACGLAYVNFGVRWPRLLAHMFNSSSTPGASAELHTAGGKLFDQLLTLITEGQKQNTFRGGDPRTLAHACWATVHGLSVLLSVGRAMEPHQQTKPSTIDVERTLDTLLEGVAVA